jgi:signal transduction histidine kinase
MDETLFSIVVTNLIENAFKYSEDEVHIIISQKQIEVKDSGIGISEENIKNITEKFYRVHTNSWNNSLGLGLFLVNKLAQLHHFTLKIKSKINEGSSFIIEF